MINYSVKELAGAVRQAEESLLYGKGADEKTVQKGCLNIFLAKFIEKRYPTDDDLTEALGNLDEVVLGAVVTFFYSEEEWVRLYRKDWEDQNRFGMSVQDPTKASSDRRNYLLIMSFEYMLNQALEKLHPENQIRKRQDVQMFQGEESVLLLHFVRFLSLRYQYVRNQIMLLECPLVTNQGVEGKTQLDIRELIHGRGKATLLFSFQKGNEKVEFKANYAKRTGNIFGYRFNSCNTDVLRALEMIKDVSSLNTLELSKALY